MAAHYELIKLCMIGTFCLIGIFCVIMSLVYARRTWKLKKTSEENFWKMIHKAKERMADDMKDEKDARDVDPHKKPERDPGVFTTKTCKVIYSNPGKDPKVDELFETIDEAFSASGDAFAKFGKAFSKFNSVVSE